MATDSGSGSAQRNHRRSRQERQWLLVICLALVAVLGLFSAQAWQQVRQDEAARLQALVSAAETELARRLDAVFAALVSVRRDLPDWTNGEMQVGAARRLRALKAVMPGVRELALLDAQGQLLASSGDAAELIRNLPPDFTRRHALGTDPNWLSIDVPATLGPASNAPPAATPGVSALASVTVWGEARGEIAEGGQAFGGVMVALLDGDYFTSGLQPLLYAPDMVALLIHADGTLIAQTPARPGRVGLRLDDPQSLFSQHLQRGGGASVQQAQTQISGVERLAALQDLLPRQAAVARPLVLAISRSPAAVHAGWRQQTAWQAVSLAMLAALAWMLLLQQQRRRALQTRQEALAERQQAQQTERLELALAGADLALWDSDLLRQRTVVNARWYQMLGHAEGAFDAHAGWAERVHPDDLATVQRAQQAHQAGQTSGFDTTYRMRHAQGHWVWVMARGRVVERAADGRALRMVGTHMDVTERKRAEDALRSSEGRVRALLESLRSGVVVHAPDMAVLQANPAACSILGLSLAQMTGKLAIDPAWRFLEEDGTVMAHERYPVQQVARSGRPLRNFIGGLQRPDRERPLWVLCNGFQVLGADGSVQQFVVTFTDITERKEAEEDLRRSEGRLRLAGRVARLGGWRLEREPLRFSFTPETLLILQAGAQDDAQPAQAGAGDAGLGDFDTALALVEPADRERTRAALLHSLDSGDAFNQQLYVHSGAQRRCLRMLGEVERDAQGHVLALQGAVQDITEAQQERQQLQLMQACVAQLNDVVLITEAQPLDEPGPRIVFANQAFERLTGWSPAEVIGHSPRRLQGPLTDRHERQRIRQALEAAEPVRAEMVNYRRDGQPYWIDLVIAPVFDAQGQVTHQVAVQRDISQRVQAEAGLREAQQALQATLEAVPDLLFEVDLQGLILSQHSPRKDLLLQAPAQFLGRQVQQVLPPGAASVVMDALRQAHEHGRSQGQQYCLDLPVGQRWFELSVSSKPTPPDQVPRFIALARDISERKLADEDRQRLERQLREAQKMESIGTLAGGIAHDFNNILAAILGNVALARGDLPEDHRALTSLDQIQRAGQRARSLVQQILTFSRRSPHTLIVQPLRAVVEETLSLLRATLPAGVRVDTLLSDAPLPVLADATQLPQVLMNLCTNAWHALPEDGGRIEVGLEALPAGDPRRAALGTRHAEAGLQPLPEVDCAHLWVRDDGQGMDATTRQRIFDPFFTTKPVGRGTGLGLSVVHGIVNTLNGALRLDSVPGQGSCFHVFLPLTTSADTATAPAPAPVHVTGAAVGGCVLYVDDDEVMVLMVQRLLERAGHQVLAFSDAQQALARLRDPTQAVDLLVTDFNMPGLSGLDLCRQALGLRPGLPMAISSGYISERLRVEAEELGVRALLKKENTLDELPALVHRLLLRPAGAG